MGGRLDLIDPSVPKHSYERAPFGLFRPRRLSFWLKPSVFDVTRTTELGYGELALQRRHSLGRASDKGIDRHRCLACNNQLGTVRYPSHPSRGRYIQPMP